MAAPIGGTQDSDSDSSNEDLERFREAAWVPPGAHQEVSGEKNEKKTHPSLRVRPDCHEHDGNELQTTPEFRSHVSKKLAAILDSSIREVSQNQTLQMNKPENDDSDEEGFRLFRTSLPREAVTVTSSIIPRKKMASSSSEDSEEEQQQRCREAAVSADDILRHSALQHEPQSTPSNICDNQPKKKKRKKKKKDRSDTTEVKLEEEAIHIEPGKNELQAKRKKKRKQNVDVAHCEELGDGIVEK
ncbi:protein CUSTOS [Xenopus tropicalis]|uniref:Protein CUSTOS n=1 Tax=Xenopus tropicalis TaxID=8364 RepID=A0A6I8RTQ7_XENTR|nr:protein CUSTOS [Xenopus tropicalis]